MLNSRTPDITQQCNEI